MTTCQDAPGVERIAKLIREAAPTVTHVDDFIDDPFKSSPGERYARWMLLHFRLSALNFQHFSEFIADRLLYCTFEGKRWRVVGASRMGDVWLNSHLHPSYEPGSAGSAFYEERVAVDACSRWDGAP
jgi:hypothetical protein